MSIRNRLLVLLLAIGLTPLILTSLLQQASIRLASSRMAYDARGTLEASAKLELQEQLEGHVQVLERERRLVDALLRSQAREIEQRLAKIWPQLAADRPAELNFFDGTRGRGMARGGPGEPGDRGGRPFGPSPVRFSELNAGFGRDPNLGIPADSQRFAFESSTPSAEAGEAASPNTPALKVDYRCQSCFTAAEANEVRVKEAMAELATMTAVYSEIYNESPESVVWLTTSLGLGVTTAYPGGVVPSDVSQYERFRGDWYGQARMAFWDQRNTLSGRVAAAGAGDSPRTQGGAAGRRNSRRAEEWRRFRLGMKAMQGAPPTRDPLTGQMVLVRSMPITYPDGSFAGATAVVRTIHEIFASMQLPERWGTDTQRMLVLVDPNTVDPATGKRTWASVLLHDGGEDSARQGEGDPPGGPPPGDLPPNDRGRGPGPGMQRPPGGPQWPELSADTNDVAALATMVDDIANGRAGAQQMVYRGRQCLLAYRPLNIEQVAAILVVPYERIVSLSTTMEQSLLRERMFWLQSMTMILLGVGVVAVVVAALKARSVTNPIHALIEAGKKLGNGDYDARVEIGTGDEFENLGRVFNEAGPKLRDREKMKRSLELAAATQQSLLPAQPPAMDHFEVAGRCLYCDETGGDYYDFIDLSSEGSRRVGLASGDVSGHGIGAALLMAATRGMLHADAEHYGCDLSSMIRGLNARLVRDAADGQFITLFYGILEDRTRSLTWVSAGHEPALWYHGRSGQVEDLANTGLPLGVERDATFEQAGPITLEPGDVLVMSTDGIREARNRDDVFFGKERLVDIVRQKAGLSADQICTAILDAVTQFVEPAPRTDDITLVIVKAR
jgi:sigma-B regulation protein RsbU (phosphoserine phosphatase)